jgi:hypothetical protein
MMFAFKILSLAVLMIAGVAGLYGKPRNKKNRFTRNGLILLSAVIGSFLCGIAIEIKAWDEDRIQKIKAEKEKAAEILQARFEENWKFSTAKPIMRLHCVLFYRKELPVHELLNYFSEIRFKWRLLEKDGIHQRSFFVSHARNSKFIDSAYGIGIFDEQNKYLGSTSRLTIIRKPLTADTALFAKTPIELINTSQAKTAHASGPNDSSTRKGLNNVTGKIAGWTINYNDWIYTNHVMDIWTDSTQLACGVEWLLPIDVFHISTINDLQNLDYFEIRIPKDFNLRLFDEFSLAFDDFYISQISKKADWQRVKSDSSWVLSITGHSLYKEFKSNNRMEFLATDSLPRIKLEYSKPRM